jgi:hypothetical protein
MAKATRAAANRPDQLAVIDIAQQQGLDEQGLVREVGANVIAFVGSLALFFKTATALEAKAKGTLAIAQQLKAQPPKNGADDEVLQRFIIRAREEYKGVTAHWEITSKISKFHKTLTAARARATDALEEAGKIATELHNDYTRAEQRRVEAENQRREDQARSDQQAIRDRELAEAEAAAIAEEAKSEKLSLREGMFLEKYLATGNAILAARHAGYRDAAAQAPKLIASAKIIDAIAGKREADELRKQAAALATKPLDPVHIEEVKADVGKAGSDRTTYSAKVTDAALFIKAVIAQTHGIPVSCLAIDQTQLNICARDFRELINRWPGVELVKKTGVI